MSLQIDSAWSSSSLHMSLNKAVAKPEGGRGERVCDGGLDGRVVVVRHASVLERLKVVFLHVLVA
jgi:hypothetical protein